MNAFAVLGTGERLELADEELREAFRQAGQRVHPDAGGADGEFAALREAMAILSSPSRRLKHWLELRGISADPRGSIDPRMMDLFAKIGAVTQQAESVIRKRAEAKSSLAKALLESRTQECRDQVEAVLAEVEHELSAACGGFGGWETSLPEGDRAGQIVRDLAFLEKWKASLRSVYSRLI
jgi:curved DNA-binding protein CbpA